MLYCYIHSFLGYNVESSDCNYYPVCVCIFVCVCVGRWDYNPEDSYFSSYTYIFAVNILPSNLCLWILLISYQHVI